jgi:hypothetical protein
MKYPLIAADLAAETVTAFTFVVNMPDIDSTLLRNRPKR